MSLYRSYFVAGAIALSSLTGLVVFGQTSPAAAEPRAFVPHGQIIWDKYSVPHIYGQTAEDVLYGYGFAQMKNHAETILRKAATGRGRTAEYFGAGDQNKNVASDIQIRTYGIPARSQSWLAQGTEEQRRYLSIFCDGANAYASQPGSRIDPALRRVLPVVPTDILNMLQDTIHFNFMLRQWRMSEVIQLWQQNKPTNPFLNAATVGSNGWALAPSKSANGHAMLMGNPHLAWGVNQVAPDLDIFQLVEAHLVIGDPMNPTLNASGASFTGAPFINIGFSDDIGWTHTNNTIKNADLYDIKLSAPGEYLLDGVKHTLTQRQARILVRQSNGALAPLPITITSSEHGPIVAARADGHLLALRVAGLDGNSVTSEYWGMMRAHSLAEFNLANKTLQMPFFNVIFADRQGEIMYLFGGKQPVRKGGIFTDYLGVLDGNSSKTLWTRTMAWGALPKTINPPSGFVQNSNDPPWSSTFPSQINPSAFPAWLSPVEMMLRAQNSTLFLLSKQRLSLDDVIAGKENTTMLLASRLLPDLIAAARTSGNPLAVLAASVLQQWDQTANANSKGGSLFQRWYEYYLADPNSGRSPVFGSSYPAFRIEWTPANPLATPVGLTNPGAAVQALVRAAQELSLIHALDAAWGTYHRVVLATHDPTFTLPIPIANRAQSGAPDVFGPVRVIESVAEGPLRLGVSGDSYVFVADFDPHGPATAKAVMTYGNASRPGSSHIKDQLPIFEAKTLRPVLRQRAEVLTNAASVDVY